MSGFLGLTSTKQTKCLTQGYTTPPASLKPGITLSHVNYWRTDYVTPWLLETGVTKRHVKLPGIQISNTRNLALNVNRFWALMSHNVMLDSSLLDCCLPEGTTNLVPCSVL